MLTHCKNKFSHTYMFRLNNMGFDEYETYFGHPKMDFFKMYCFIEKMKFKTYPICSTV